MLYLLSDIYSTAEKSRLTLLALVDVFAAFNMVDHDPLLQCNVIYFGFTGTAQFWLRSYLSGLTQIVIIFGDTIVPLELLSNLASLGAKV